MKRITFLLVFLLVLLTLSVYPASASNAASSFASTASGYAFGDYTSIDSILAKTTSGPTAPVAIACNHTPTTLTNSTNSSAASLAVSSNEQTMITTSRTATSATVQASSDIQNLSLLNGLIKANRIHVAASSTATTTGATSANNSTFSGLAIAGTLTDPATTTPAPNTREDIPGVGYVILNEQNGPVNGPGATSISVIGIHVHITLGLSAGSEIVMGSASSSETSTTQPAVVNAYGYGLYANGVAGSGSSSFGPISPVGIGCTGGSAQNSASGFNSAILGNSGAVSTSASGQLTPSDANATSQTTVSNLNVLTSLISADKVTITANADWNGTGSRSGSMTLTNGKVNGTALSRSPSPNTRINLPGIGYVVVNEQWGSNNAAGATENVIAFDVYVTVPNNMGLTNGSQIVIGYASASANSY